MYKSLNPLYLFSLSIIVLGIIFAGSRGSLLVVLSGIGVFLVYGRMAGSALGALAVIVVVLAIGVAYSLNEDSVLRFAGTFDEDKVSNLSSRLDIWQSTLLYWALNPWVLVTGVGAMNFAYAVSLPGIQAEHAHSDYLTVTTELGLLGLVFLLGFVVAFLKTMRIRVRSTDGRTRWEHLCFFAAFLGLTAASLFETTFYIHTGSIPMLRVVLGVLLLYENIQRREAGRMYEARQL
jgi:O-antigen ligase